MSQKFRIEIESTSIVISGYLEELIFLFVKKIFPEKIQAIALDIR